MSNVPFIDYLNAVDDLLESRYGITSNDVDTASIAHCQDNAWTPDECVQWLAEKYDLERIDLGPYGTHNRVTPIWEDITGESCEKDTRYPYRS